MKKKTLYIHNKERINECRFNIIKNITIGSLYTYLIKDKVTDVFINYGDMFNSDYVDRYIFSTFSFPLFYLSFNILCNVSKIDSLKGIQKELKKTKEIDEVIKNEINR